MAARAWAGMMLAPFRSRWERMQSACRLLWVPLRPVSVSRHSQGELEALRRRAERLQPQSQSQSQPRGEGESEADVSVSLLPGAAVGSTAEVAWVYYRSSEVALRLAEGQTVLEAGLEADLAMEFSCQMGGCGACMIRVLQGEVVMEEPNCLTDEERAEGYCLACVSHPRGHLVVES